MTYSAHQALSSSEEHTTYIREKKNCKHHRERVQLCLWLQLDTDTAVISKQTQTITDDVLYEHEYIRDMSGSMAQRMLIFWNIENEQTNNSDNNIYMKRPRH